MQHQTHSFDKAEAFDLLQPDADGRAAALTARWQSLDEAGRVIASLAGEDELRLDAQFVSRIETGAAAQRHAAEQGVDDLSAMIEPGLAALLYVCENGGDARVPAAALWREFSAARTALLALAPVSKT